MLANFLKIFVVTTVTFFLFFYSTPYWTGAEMEDLMNNGVYRFFYVLCSKLGYWAYQLIEVLSSQICALLGGKGRLGRNNRLHLLVYTLLSLCLLTGAVVGLNYGYESLFRTMFAVGDGINVSNEHTVLSRFSDLVIFFKLTAGYLDGTFFGVFRAIGKALLMCIAYFFGTAVFFSFMFGLLRQKVIPIHEDSPSDQNVPARGEAAGLLEQCMDGVKDAVNKICYLCYFKIPGLLPVFLLLAAAYSLVLAWAGGNADAEALASDIVDSTGIIDTVVTFIVELILGKLFYYIGVPIYRALPEGVQGVLREWSDRGEDWAYDELSRRNDWSNQNDAAWNAAGWHGFEPRKPFRGLKKMDLFGSEGRR